MNKKGLSKLSLINVNLQFDSCKGLKRYIYGEKEGRRRGWSHGEGEGGGRSKG